MASTGVAQLKRLAAEKAVELVRDGMRVGLGTGSTAQFAVQRLGELLREGKLRDIVGVPTSEATERQAREEGIPLARLEEVEALDLAIDGADEADPHFNLVKGWGAALLREKMVEQLARRLVIVVDDSKLVDALGRRGVPVEVVQFGWQHTARQLAALGCEAQLRRTVAGEPVVTDNGNYIVDCKFADGIRDCAGVAAAMKGMCGVVEHGLFLGMASDVVCASEAGVRFLERQ